MLRHIPYFKNAAAIDEEKESNCFRLEDLSISACSHHANQPMGWSACQIKLYSGSRALTVWDRVPSILWTFLGPNRIALHNFCTIAATDFRPDFGPVKTPAALPYKPASTQI